MENGGGKYLGVNLSIVDEESHNKKEINKTQEPIAIVKL